MRWSKFFRMAGRALQLQASLGTDVAARYLRNRGFTVEQAVKILATPTLRGFVEA